MTSVHFRGANLTDANFNGADVSEAVFRGATFNDNALLSLLKADNLAEQSFDDQAADALRRLARGRDPFAPRP